jgi:hypothetical protein
MFEIGLILLFAVISLGAAWLVNRLIALLSGDHPRDTGRVWLDIMLGDFRGVSSFVASMPPGLRWIAIVAVGIAIAAVLFFVSYVD